MLPISKRSSVFGLQSLISDMDISNINKFPSLDEGFPKRVLKTSIIIESIFILYSLFFNSLAVTIGLAIGGAISIFSVKILLTTLNSFFVPDVIANKKNYVKRIVTFTGICKLILISAVLFLVFRYLRINLIALFVGISVVQIVIVFKMLGLLFVNYLNKTSKTESRFIRMQ